MGGNFQTKTFAKPHFLIVIKNKFLKFQLVIFWSLKPLQNPKTIHFVLGFSLFQHKHNKIKQNNHTNPTITAHLNVRNDIRRKR